MDLFELSVTYKDVIVHCFIKIIKINYADFSLEPLPSLTWFYEVEYLAATSERAHRLH